MNFGNVEGHTGFIFNIGGSQELSILAIAKKIMKALNKKNKIKLKPAPEGSANRRCPDISKIKKFIDFKPSISITEGINLILNKK